MHRPHAPRQHLDPSDVVLLTVLGAVHDAPRSLAEIIAAARDLAPDAWQPTADVIGDGVAGAINAGLLEAVPAATAASVIFRITDHGRTAFRDLLRRPAPCQGEPLRRTCMATKLCYLDCLEPLERSSQLEDLARPYQDGIEELRRRSAEQSARLSPPQRWLHHEIERCEWELAWLDRLRTDMLSARADNQTAASSEDHGRRTP